MQGPIAYTDGACLGNPGPGGWGVRILYPDGQVREFGGAVPATTNNRMELQAAIEALKRLQPYAQAHVMSDSRYVIEGLTKWIVHWQRRGWITTAQTPVKNRELWMALQELNHPGVRWQHVRGHRGDPGNERVDAIARAFAQGLTPTLFCGAAGSSADPVAASPVKRSASSTHQTPFDKARYISLVQGQVALDDDWQACAQRVRGVSGARYKKVHTAEELAAFCAQHGVVLPPEA